jgi:type I restriction enzyme, S subunit
MNPLTEDINFIPKNWSEKLLGEISQIVMGQSPSSSAYNEIGEGKPLVQGNADIKKRLTVPRIWTSEITKECRIGDIIMTVRAPVGAIAKSTHNSCLGRGVCAITPNKVNSEYLFQLLISYEEKWKRIEQGSTFTAVNGQDIKQLKLLLPPLPEQQKIAEILSTVDEKIEVIDQQIEQTKQLKKGLMQRLLTKGIGHAKFKDSVLGEIPMGWEVGLLENFALRKSGHTPNKQFPEYYDGNIKWVSLADSKSLDKRWIDDTKIKISSEGLKNSSAVMLSKGTVILLRDASVGRSAVIKEPMAVSQHFIGYSCMEKLNNWFLYYYFQKLKPHFERIAIGSTIKTIGLPYFKKMVIPIPSIKEQEYIANLLLTTDDKIDTLESKKLHYQTLKKGLMQKLLTGKIRVNHLIEKEAML